MKQTNGSRKKKTSLFDRLLTFTCAMILILGALFLGDRVLQTIRVRNTSEEASNLYHSAMSGFVSASAYAAGEPATTPAPDPHALYAEDNVNWELLDMFNMPVVVDEPIEEHVLQPAFVELYKRNPNLIGWITSGGDVDYPILWRDNEFYMDHDFDGRSNIAGAIFLDERNAPDMTDPQLLIYGHNMKAGTMFGNLDKLREEKYVRENPIVKLHYAWEAEPREYVIFSLFDASMEPSDSSYIKITRFEFDSDEDKMEYVNELNRRSIFKLPVDVKAEDQVVCLVTCSYSHDNGRFLIYARRLRDDETSEGMLQLMSGN